MGSGPLKKCIAALFVCGVLLGTAWSPAHSDEPAPSLERLSAYLTAKGYAADSLFADTRFVIYGDIGAAFRKSPEKAGVDARQEALARGDTVEAERIFREEYEKYKARIGFVARRDSLPAFLAGHARAFVRCEKKYGVPREVIAAIIGVESHYGAWRGGYRAFNVYVSMYLKDYRRSFAVSQLGELLAFSRKTRRDVFEYTSSYAGAIGYMQFLPYSLNRWFVGTDVYDMDQAIESTANYLAHFRKERGSLERALYAYNPSRYYVTLVLDLAEAGKLPRSK